MDLKKYVPRAMAEAKIAAAEEQVETMKEALGIVQEEAAELQLSEKEANGKIAAAEEGRKAAEARAEKEAAERAAAQAVAAKERDLRGKAEVSEANVRAELKIAQSALEAAHKMHEKHEAHMKEMKAKMETQSKVIQELTVKAATEERMRLAGEKRGNKGMVAPAPAAAPMGYVIEGLRRDGNGDLYSFQLIPKKVH